jgi:glycosyltransferase involved in cell wall biosynthesis
MTSFRPRVTAVIPAYNAAAFIPRAIASVCAQSYPVHQIVVVDDGSVDGTTAALSRLDREVHLVRQANAGPSSARNRGVAEAADADLIAFLDADDEWLPDAVEAQVAAFSRFPRLALTTADMSAVDESGSVLAPSWFDRHRLTPLVTQWAERPIQNALAALLRKNFVSTSVLLVRRDVFRALGGFRTDLRYGEDLELWARIAAAHPILCLRRALGLRRSHPHNTTKSMEPMLHDLVRTSEIVRGWGDALLRAQGMNPDEMVARAKTDLGYWYFTQGRMTEARTAFAAALAECRLGRALRYYPLTFLSARAVDRLRSIKDSVYG